MSQGGLGAAALGVPGRWHSGHGRMQARRGRRGLPVGMRRAPGGSWWCLLHSAPEQLFVMKLVVVSSARP